MGFDFELLITQQSRIEDLITENERLEMFVDVHEIIIQEIFPENWEEELNPNPCTLPAPELP